MAGEHERAFARGQGRVVPAAPRHALQIATGLAASSIPLVFAWLLPAQLPSPGVYGLLHAALQLFLVGIGGTTFAVHWYASARGLDEGRARFLGTAFLGVALLEAFHMLATPGMPGVLGPATWDRGVAYWHLGRAWTALALLAAAWIPSRTAHPMLRRGPLLAVALAMVAVLVAAELRFVGPGAMVRADGTQPPLRAAVELAVAALAVAGLAANVGPNHI